MSCGTCFNIANDTLDLGTPGDMAVSDLVPQTVGFLIDGRQGRAVMGDVKEGRGQFYVVQITSYEDREDAGLVGQTVMVPKNSCTNLQANGNSHHPAGVKWSAAKLLGQNIISGYALMQHGEHLWFGQRGQRHPGFRLVRNATG